VVPARRHRTLFLLAPCLEVFTSIIAVATLPFGDRLHVFGRDVKLVVADLDVGILWVFAIGSLSVYGILLAGWGVEQPLLVHGRAALLGADHLVRAGMRCRWSACCCPAARCGCARWWRRRAA